MIPWAAVDVLDGRAVRLREGLREALTDYGPAEGAVDRWAGEGLLHIHVVDLSAAFGGEASLGALLTHARKRWPGIVLQVGGGIRTSSGARRALDLGASRVVVGSPLFTDPGEAARTVEDLGPERCVAALDVREGRVRVKGWTQEAGAGLAEACRTATDLGFGEALVTDIGRDGLLAGPNLDLYRALGPTRLRIIASGGVASLGDLRELAGFPHVSGAVVGKALYEGRVTASQLAEFSP